MMKQRFGLSILILISTIVIANDSTTADDSTAWKRIVKKGYNIYYTGDDEDRVKKITTYIQSGIDHIRNSFRHSFRDTFDVYVFPERSSLDKQWQKDWNDPTFKSECWIIASGVAHRLDLLSPNAWQKEACDHNANDSAEIRQVIWHELVHVFHGQYNPDHTFNYIEKLDWLVEGTATFISGQLDEERLKRVRQMIADKKTPPTLDDFWKGQEKYGLSGSMVAFIDKNYGRKKLFELLQQTNKTKALEALAISETQLLSEWRKSFE
jgi:hypothetical protein